MCHSVLEWNANFQLHILIWGMERTTIYILILKRMETQDYFCSDTLSPGSESVRICLYFLGHMPPIPAGQHSLRLSPTALGWPCIVAPETELTLMLSGCGRVEWALDFQLVGWIQVPAVVEEQGIPFYKVLFNSSKYMCAFTAFISCGFSDVQRRGKKICPFYRGVHEYLGGSTCCFGGEKSLYSLAFSSLLCSFFFLTTHMGS